jgi:hypothetical protein
VADDRIDIGEALGLVTLAPLARLVGLEKLMIEERMERSRHRIQHLLETIVPS